MLTDVRTFLPGVGFRRAGKRLAAPVSLEQGDRTLTVTDLVATPEATDLVFELTSRQTDDARPDMAGERVWLEARGERYGLGGSMNVAVRTGKLVRTYAMVPISLELERVDLHVSGDKIGDWRVGLDLVPFPTDPGATYVPIGASDTRHGITVTVRGMVASSAHTALDLTAIADRADVIVHGLGGFRMRNEATALVLHDDQGISYVERFRQDARDQFPDPSGISDVAIFDALPADVRRLVLEVPSVVFDDRAPTVDVPVPVETRRELKFAGRTIGVRSSRAITIDRVPHKGTRAVAIDLELGSADDELAVIKPCEIRIDGGKSAGFGSGGKGIHGPDPRPVDVIEVFHPDETPPQMVTFVGATIRARGPWRIEFARR